MVAPMIVPGRFAAGEPFSFRSRPGVIRMFESDLAVLQYNDGEVEHTTPDVLRQAYREHDFCFTGVKIAPNAVLLDDDEQAEADWLRPYLLGMDKLEYPTAKRFLAPLIEEIAEANTHERPPGLSTLCKHYKAWKLVGKNITHLLKKEGRKRRRRIGKKLFDLMIRSIKEDYLKPGTTYTSAHDAFLERCEDLNYQDPPCKDTYTRYIHSEFDPFEIIEAREGPYAAEAARRTSTASIVATRPLERVEVDTAHFNFGVFNQEGFFVGKIVLYLVIDVYSRAILGYAIHYGKGKESASTAIQALRYAVGPKADPAYPMQGMFTELVCDGGPAYISAITQLFLNKISQKTQITPIGQGWAKPFVERFIKTLRSRLFPRLDGYMGKYDPKKFQGQRLIESAKLTIDAFREKLDHFIVHEYHHTPHSGLRNQTPAEKWEEGTKHSPVVPIEDLDDLNLLRGLPKKSTLQRHSGIFYEYEIFRHEELPKIYDYLSSVQTSGRITVEYFVDENDAGGISVVDPRPGNNGRLINVRNKDWDIAEGRSFHDLKATRAGRKTKTNQAPVVTDGQVKVKPRGKIKKPGDDVPFLDAEPTSRATKPTFDPPSSIAPRPDDLQLPITSISNNSFDDDEEDDDDVCD